MHEAAMSHSTPYGLDASELDELHEYLVAHPGADGLMLDGVHGLLSAMVAGPEPVPASEWLPRVIDEENGFDDANQSNRILSLLVRLYNSVVQELEALTYEPIFGEYEDDEGAAELAAVGWCEGFSLGIDLRSGVWESRMASDPRLMDLLDPIIRISADEGLFESDTTEQLAELDEEDRDQLLRAVGGAVADVQQYWREQPATPDEGAEPAPDPKPLLRRRAGRWVH
ncbi:MAG: YecA family protein [Rhodanobacteraceae bacterium]|nr:YecA family protein [Rhodanobacteraceae bacterium]MBP9154449.1 YecA family protein [Xanthomonadales bacterium]